MILKVKPDGTGYEVVRKDLVGSIKDIKIFNRERQGVYYNLINYIESYKSHFTNLRYVYVSMLLALKLEQVI